MGVLASLAVFIPNFLSTSLHYLDWDMKVLFSICLIYKPIKMSISNSPYIIHANPLHRELIVDPNIMSST